jgi:hypothetical protein
MEATSSAKVLLQLIGTARDKFGHLFERTAPPLPASRGRANRPAAAAAQPMPPGAAEEVGRLEEELGRALLTSRGNESLMEQDEERRLFAEAEEEEGLILDEADDGGLTGEDVIEEHMDLRHEVLDVADAMVGAEEGAPAVRNSRSEHKAAVGALALAVGHVLPVMKSVFNEQRLMADKLLVFRVADMMGRGSIAVARWATKNPKPSDLNKMAERIQAIDQPHAGRDAPVPTIVPRGVQPS